MRMKGTETLHRDTITIALASRRTLWSVHVEDESAVSHSAGVAGHERSVNASSGWTSHVREHDDVPSASEYPCPSALTRSREPDDMSRLVLHVH